MMCPKCQKEHIGYDCPHCNHSYLDTQNETKNEAVIETISESTYLCSYCGKNIGKKTAFCPYCGVKILFDINNDFYENQKSKSQISSIYYKIVFILSTIIFVCGFIITVTILQGTTTQNNLDKPPIPNNATQDTTNQNNNFPNGISKTEFNQIKIGMDYLQVSSIIGGDGMISSKDDKKSDNEIVLTWFSEHTLDKGYVEITFVDKKVTKIEDFNLY